jgi:hypothetical protein
MLKHLTLGVGSEALAGDLLEEFRIGRSAGWYRRQVLAAIVIGLFKEIRTQWLIVLFAVLWTVPNPALWFYLERFQRHSDFIGRIWALPWPWSTICAMALAFLPELLFIWAGMTIYLLLYSWMTRDHKFPKVTRGLWVSLVTFIAVTTVLATIPFSGQPIDIRTATPLTFITNPSFVLGRLPGFLALLISIWVALPDTEHRTTKIAV